jgi:hypothetical protein
MFTEPTILETIASVASALRQYESAGGSAPPAALEAAEGVLEEPATGTESAVVASAPSPTREDQGASLPQPAEAAASAAAATVADTVENIVGEAGPRRPVRSPPPRKRFHTRRDHRSPSRACFTRGHGKGCLPGDPGGRGGNKRNLVAGRREL